MEEEGGDWISKIRDLASHIPNSLTGLCEEICLTKLHLCKFRS